MTKEKEFINNGHRRLYEYRLIKLFTKLLVVLVVVANVSPGSLFLPLDYLTLFLSSANGKWPL